MDTFIEIAYNLQVWSVHPDTIFPFSLGTSKLDAVIIAVGFTFKALKIS